MSYLLNFSQWKLFEDANYSYKNLLASGLTGSGMLGNDTAHQLEDYVRDLGTNVLNPLSERKGGVLDNGCLVVVFFNPKTRSGASDCKTGDITREVEKILNLEWKPAPEVQLPVVFIIQDIAQEFKFDGIPFFNEKGEKISDDYPIVQNDAYLHVFGPEGTPNWEMASPYLKVVEQKLTPTIKKINIERIGAFGRGLLINRIGFSGSCLPDQEVIMVDKIISKLFG